jgi:transcriptional regulator with GAF, ATPase, and Fis domain
VLSPLRERPEDVVLLGISLETLRYRMEKHALTTGEHEPR